MPFAQMGLRPELLRGIETHGWVEPTPIQAQAVPIALRGVDVLGCAQTGSGKTGAFVLPILHRLLSRPGPGIRALVLVPTRELAAQVYGAFRDSGRFTSIRAAVVIGGVGYGEQRKSLSGGAQVIVATPGRLLDHLQGGTYKLDRVEQLVLDEADRMLDMGFLPDIRRIIERLPRERQTFLFSATLLPKVEAVAAFALRHPERVNISPPTAAAETITQKLYPVSQAQKSELLTALLKSAAMRSVLIFCRTKHGADRLARRLKQHGFPVGVLHADRTQGQRTEAMQRFRDGKVPILVATDIAARGIDVREISHVINYDVPLHPEDYVHRVGRTGRAQAVGDAITLMDPEEQPLVTAIETFTGSVFERAALEGFGYAVAPKLQPPRPKTFADMRWGRRAARSRRSLFRR